jgi:prepilin-type N-terminal cleavage/methylation domain-containing protein
MSMRSTLERAKGFTLIEVMVVLTIITIVSTVFLVDWTSGRVNRQVGNEAREVETLIREAQNYALTGSQAVAGTEPCRFQVTWGGANYGLTYWYKDGSGNCTQTRTMKSFTLSDGVVFSATSSFYFTLPHAELSFLGPSQAIVMSKASSFQTVCVFQGGLINSRIGSTCL